MEGKDRRGYGREDQSSIGLIPESRSREITRFSDFQDVIVPLDLNIIQMQNANFIILLFPFLKFRENRISAIGQSWGIKWNFG